jgi:hypothetical protein
MMTYSSLFKCKRIETYLLQDKAILDELRAEGYCWIKRLNHTRFHEITRNPTIGCTVELFTLYNVGTVPIDSFKGKKLINKLCYF